MNAPKPTAMTPGTIHQGSRRLVRARPWRAVPRGLTRRPGVAVMLERHLLCRAHDDGWPICGCRGSRLGLRLILATGHGDRGSEASPAGDSLCHGLAELARARAAAQVVGDRAAL